MALIEKFEKDDKNIRKQDPVYATYLVSILGGEKYFQVNTYGS